MVIGWLIRKHTEHMVDEIAYLRSELRFERDRNARLQDAFLSLQTHAPIHSVAPPSSREPDMGAEKLAADFRGLEDLRIGEIPA
jgi:hypothetical protein